VLALYYTMMNKAGILSTMVTVIQAQTVNIIDLKEQFGLQLDDSNQFFTEWFDNLPEITESDVPKYALSDELTLLKRENELYKVLSILKNLGQILI